MKITYTPTDKEKIDKYLSIGDPTLINKTISVEHPVDDMTLPDLMGEIIMPLLLGMGYSQKTIESVVNIHDPEDSIS
jgi:hypothetical protein